MADRLVVVEDDQGKEKLLVKNGPDDPGQNPEIGKAAQSLDESMGWGEDLLGRMMDMDFSRDR